MLFDLDGVIIDSRIAIGGCINHALAQQGFEARREEELHALIGPPLVSVFSELIGQRADSAAVLGCLDAYRRRYARVYIRDSALFAGIADTLAAMASERRLAVATSKPRAFADPLLEAFGLRDLFTAISAPALAAIHEDKATTIRRAIQQLRIDRAVMVGDRRFDMAGAHVNGLPAIGVSWGVGTPEELARAGAHAIVDRPSELPSATARLLGGAASRS